MDNLMTSTQLHATCVAICGGGVLLCGPPGAGKSDLALRLIDGGAALVADDRVDVTVNDGRLLASAPNSIAGMVEVRGVGIVRMAYDATAALALVVDLVARADVPRLPIAADTVLFGVTIRHLQLCAFDSSTPAKIRLALATAPGAMVEPT